MARPRREPLRAVSAAERAEVERLRRSSSERTDRVRRAAALLATAQGQPFTAAAKRAGLASGSTVTALTIAAGWGRHPTYDAARASVFATAQRTPERRQDGPATWSLGTLERTARREGLPATGATTIRRQLRAAGSSYQRTRTWRPTGTAVRQRTSGPVTVTDPQTEQTRG